MDNTTVIETRRGSVTLEEALDSDLDVLPSLYELHHLFDFREYLCSQRSQIERLVSRHLGIPSSQFILSEEAEWISGSFNICLPINVSNSGRHGLPRRAMIRFPLPFNVGEAFSPGSIDEKLRCEAATYIWLNKYCPSIPIPRLLGMGFPGSQSVSGSSVVINRCLPPTNHIASLPPLTMKTYGIAYGGYSEEV